MTEEMLLLEKGREKTRSHLRCRKMFGGTYRVEYLKHSFFVSTQNLTCMCGCVVWPLPVHYTFQIQSIGGFKIGPINCVVVMNFMFP